MNLPPQEAWPHYAALAGCVVLTVSAQLLLKAGARGRESYARSFLNGLTLAGYALFGLNTILAVYAMQRVTLKTASTWSSASFLMVVLLAGWLLKEPLSWRKLAGCGLIVAGIVVFFAAG